MAAVMPWWPTTPETKWERVGTLGKSDLPISHESIKYGIDPDRNFGWRYFGPVSEEVGQMEFNRLVRAFESIKQEGFHKNYRLKLHGEPVLNEMNGLFTVEEALKEFDCYFSSTGNE